MVAQLRRSKGTKQLGASPALRTTQSSHVLLLFVGKGIGLPNLLLVSY